MKLLIGVFMLVASVGQAQDMLPGIPDFGSDPLMLTSDSMVLGRGCLMMPGTDLGIACNPALLADSEITQLRMNVYADDGFGQVRKQYDLVRHEDSVGLIDDLLKKDSAVLSQAGTSVWYQRDWWMLSFTPLRIRYAVAKQNPAYPEIATYIRRDMEVAWSGGMHVEGDRRLRLGFTSRYHWSDVLHQQFAVLDAVANPELIKIGQQSGLIFDTGLAYELEDKYHTNLVMAATGLEVLRSGLSQGNAKPMADVGFTFRPEWDGCKWTLGSQFSFLGDQAAIRRFRLTSLLETEWINFSTALAVGDIGVGLSTAIDSVTIGIGYINRDFSADPSWGGNRAEEFMVDAGLRF